MKNTVTITLDDKKVQALKMYLSEKKRLIVIERKFKQNPHRILP